MEIAGKSVVYSRSGFGWAARASGWPRLAAAAAARRHDPRVVLQVVLALLFAVAAVAFAHVVEDYLTGDPIVRWDVELSQWLHGHAIASLVSFFEVVTYAGNGVVLGLVTLAVTLYLLRRRRLDAAALLCGAAIGIEILNPVLKLIFHRPRPELAYVHLDTYAFPSGHATGSAAIYGVALYLLVRHASTRRRVLAGIAYAGLVVVIGFSRLYLEVHYLSDVLAGLSLGFAWACACLFAYERRADIVARHLPRRVRSLAERVAR